MRTIDELEKRLTQCDVVHVWGDELRHLIAIARAAHEVYSSGETRYTLRAVKGAQKAGLFGHPSTCDCVECEESGKGVFIEHRKEGEK